MGFVICIVKMALGQLSWLAREGPVLGDMAGKGGVEQQFRATCQGTWASCSISRPWPPHLPNRDSPGPSPSCWGPS